MTFIRVENVTKEFKIFQRKSGLLPSIISLFHRDYINKQAVNNISFNIEKGELVGYIGANGAGKSTTIKMLSGILLPTSGKITVDGIEPWKKRKENARKIGTVFGQRTQLYWNLPMEETFSLFRKIYKIEKNKFTDNKDFYIDLLDMKDFLRTPVRQLSLGQRMRAELVVALLHDPSILYLDEPTIGLDIVVKSKIRNFIKEINRLKATTVILTTHDMDDIEEICNRIITIDNGQLLFDGSLNQFKENYSNGHVIVADFQNPNIKFHDTRLSVIKEIGTKKWILINKKIISPADAIRVITRDANVIDIKIEEPNIEDAVRRIYQKDLREKIRV